MKNLVIFLFAFFCCIGYAQEREYVKVKKTVKLMGSPFNITVVAAHEELANINILEAIAEITRIENMISSWNEESETCLVNENAGIMPVKVGVELFELIEKCIEISVLTDGAFDITYASMDKIWKFDGSMNVMPKKEVIKKSVEHVGYKNIVLDSKNHTVFLKEKGMRIAFGAIGKGYAADKAKAFLVSREVIGGIIDAAGDLTAWGTDVDDKKWIVGVANSESKSKIVSTLPLVESSVATSGKIEKTIVLEDKKYSHIIDPRTGYPSSEIEQVSIFAKSAAFCDALATAVFVLGKEEGIALVNQLGGVEVVLFDNQHLMHKSKGVFFDENP